MGSVVLLAGGALSSLTPRIGLRSHINNTVGFCGHPQSDVFEKTTSNGSVAYLMCCTTCGAKIPQPKGSMTHEKVCARFFVHSIKNKTVADAAGEKYRADRDKLREAEFDRYQAYIHSIEWRQLRSIIIERDRLCVSCMGPAEVVHHITYERLYAEDWDDLVALCHSCHEEVHGRC